ncbi:hypothetical protein DXG01_017251 [Tephrocybe rancida]|nr:hypothetical protein DXG01_017251 [Tephrocybe rancida]
MYDKLTQHHGGNILKKEQFAYGDIAARKVFDTLLGTEQLEWEQQARDEHAVELKAWKEFRSGVPSKDPADRQCAIEGVSKFATPILDLLEDLTGWKWQLQGGGPEPADGGQLNTMSVSSGTTMGDVSLMFVQSKKETYKKYILPIWGSYLRKCFTPAECHARAMEDAGISIADLGLDQGNTMVTTVENVPSFTISGPVKPAPKPRTMSSQGLGTSMPTQVPPTATSRVPSQPPSHAPSCAPSQPPSHAPSPAPASSHALSQRVANKALPGSSCKKQWREGTSTATEPPEWFNSAFCMLRSKDLGPGWTTLLDAWTTFEAQAAYKAEPPLPATGRPTAIADWINHARAPKYLPDIAKTPTLQTDFLSWFSHICLDLRHLGKNGFLSVIAGLFFWANGLLATKGRECVAWEGALRQVTEAFMG